MSIKKNKADLGKLEKLLDEAGYVLRLEKGNFNSGYCILEHRRVVVVNKFLDIEGRVNVLSDLAPELKIELNRLTTESKRFLESLLSEEEKGKRLHQMVEQEIELGQQEKVAENEQVQDEKTEE